ncbi:MAG: immunoglobulin domain-containing protein [Bacteroidales bacterium]
MKKLYFLLILILTLNCRVNSQVSPTDSLVLVDLFNSTNGPNWFDNTNWLTGPVSSWYGISLTPDGSRVKTIMLGGNNLSEQLPQSIGDLTELYSLELAVNYLSGQIPQQLGALVNLYFLNLSYNQFSGIIPWGNANLQNLYVIYLHNNDLYGAFPGSLLNNTIHIMGLSHNHFTFIPDYSSQPVNDNFIVGYNNLDFASLEPNASLFLNEGGYWYQDSVLSSMDTTVVQGSDLVLHSKVGGTSNLYVWTKNDVDIPGEIDSNLVLQNITFADSGWYSCNINNSVIINLTLNRKKIHVHVIDSTTPVVPLIPAPEGFHAYVDNTEKILTLDMDLKPGSKIQVALFNLQGKKVRDLFRGYPKYKQLRYGVEALPAGLYFVKFESQKQIFTEKVFIN